MAGFVISGARNRGDGRVVYEVVTDSLQRLYVMVPYRYATSDQATEIIEHAIAGITRPTKPTGITTNGA